MPRGLCLIDLSQKHNMWFLLSALPYVLLFLGKTFDEYNDFIWQDNQ